MKKKNKYFLNCYKEWIKTVHMPEGGLCMIFDEEGNDQFDGKLSGVFELLYPTAEDKYELIDEGLSGLFWGRGVPKILVRPREFTPLRQTIVLFCAALNGEL